MFGYIAINKAEMKFKDYDVYHSYYCGLCKRLKECYGIRGQVTLSFDMTFLIVLLTGLYEPETRTDVENCIAHPFKKHTARTNQFTDYAAAVNLILTYYKCKDDWEDDRDRRKYISARLLRSQMRQLQKEYPSKMTAVSSNLRKLTALEQKNEQNIDLMAGLFGNIMAELFAYRKDEWESSLRKIGFFLGKFIYLMDAYEDYDTDLQRNAYNPLVNLNRESGQDFDTLCRLLLTSMMSECAKSFERLPILLHADILRNVLYSGVWSRFEYLQLRKQRAEEKAKKKMRKQ